MFPSSISVRIDTCALWVQLLLEFFHQSFLTPLYESTGRAIALPLASASAFASALTKKFKFYVKVFKTSYVYFLKLLMDLV